MLGQIGLVEGNTQRGKLRAHGRIDIGIRAAYLMTAGLGERRDAAHESAADTEDMDTHISP